MAGRKKLSQKELAKLIIADKETWYSLEYVAELFGVHATTIRNWKLPEYSYKHSPTLYRLSDMVSACTKQSVEKIERLIKKNAHLEGSTIDWGQSLKKEQTKTVQLKNKQLELKLIEYAPLKYYLLNIVQRFVSSLDDIPARVSPKVIGCKDREEAYLLLKDEMRIVKSALAEMTLDNYESKPIGIEEESPSGFLYDKESDTFIRDSPTDE